MRAASEILNHLKVWQFRRWWAEHWFHVHIVATPIGSTVVTYLMSGASLNDIWNTREEFKAAAELAPLGILIHTALAALLEATVMIMVLGFALAGQVYEDYKERQAKREAQRKEYIDSLKDQGREEAIALALEADRQRKETGEELEEAMERLTREGWQPPRRSDADTNDLP